MGLSNENALTVQGEGGRTLDEVAWSAFYKHCDIHAS